MLNLTAIAVRDHDHISVSIVGQVASSCQSADVVDKYPGGDRVYVTDPGAAQVFIAERTRPGLCSELLIPWHAEVRIFDASHSDVEIYVNEQQQLRVPVAKTTGRYDVYSLTGGINPSGHCIVVAEGKPVLTIYTHRFGPASREACDQYIHDYCKLGDPA